MQVRGGEVEVIECRFLSETLHTFFKGADSVVGGSDWE